MEGLILGVNIDSLFIVIKEKMVYNGILLSVILLCVRLGICGSVFLNVFLYREIESVFFK